MITDYVANTCPPWPTLLAWIEGDSTLTNHALSVAMYLTVP